MNTLFVLISTVLVMIMVPAIGFLYGGMVRKKNVLSTISMSMVSLAITSIHWIIIGYSLVFGSSILGIIGSLNNLGLKNVGIENYAYVAFQLMFAAVTLTLIISAVVERIKPEAFLLFSILWLTFVYAPIAHWTWNGNGFLNKMGFVDFAGGLVVHATAGFSSLALALIIGQRIGFQRYPFLPNNIPLALIGTMLLWFGWFGFNAGSALDLNEIALNAFLSTNTAAAAGLLSWMLISWLKENKISSLGMASGIIAGLGAITPGAGFISPINAIIIGFVSSILCYYVMNLRIKKGIDESLDCFSIHGISGTFGLIATGIFSNVAKLHIQIIGALIGIIYSFIVTYIIAYIIDKTIGLRVIEEEEYIGLDVIKHGEHAYS